MPVIMGTAGHIDHGKTSLIKALTGIDCDRLDEEKKRGITIELGFAFLDLPGPEGADNRLSIVDVPGHERFVKNMVSGAAGIDFVVLVVAADEGVMPQTREHLEICSLLGISTGLVALTKTDMVDQEWLEMVTEDVREYLGNTFLADAPMFPVSSRTGEGVEELRAGLAELAGKFQPRRRSDLFRLPVDRVFTMKGHGTVVTGTMISGRIAVGEDVVLFPSGKGAKVRNLQSHGRAVEEAPAGRRTAVNLQGLEVEDVDRGEVLARPGTLFPAKAWDVVLTCLASSPLPLKHRKQVHFHHGSREVMARVHLLDREVLEPGETGVVKMVFESPMAGVFGDRVVLRSFSPLRTMAGGLLVNPESRKVKRFSKGADLLRSLAEPDVETADVALAQLSFAGPEGLRFAELAIMTNAESKELEKILNNLSGQRKALLFDKEERRYVHGEVFQAACDSVLRFLDDYHKREPMKPGVGKSEVESSLPAKPGKRLPSKLFHLVVERLIRDGEIEIGQEVIFRAGHTVSLASDQEALRTGILKAYVEGGALPPNLKDVLEEMGVTENEAKPVVQLLVGEGKLVRLKAGMLYDAAALKALTDSIVAWTEEHGELGPGDLKGFTGLTRKYAIPVLEYLDEARITIRVGDKRVLRKR